MSRDPPLVLGDLLGRNGRRFSPYVWRIRMALAHKGLSAQVVDITLSDKSAIEGWSDYRLAPVLKHGEEVVCDSWSIAGYLERGWPARAALFPNEAARAFALFLNGWVRAALYPLVLPMITRDVLDHVHPGDRAIYRRTREARLGCSLEEAQATREARLPVFRAELSPVRGVVETNDFLCGSAPSYADYVLFGLFQWARCTSRFRLLEKDDPLHAWRTRLLGLHDGLAAAAPGYPC